MYKYCAYTRDFDRFFGKYFDEDTSREVYNVKLMTINVSCSISNVIATRLNLLDISQFLKLNK